MTKFELLDKRIGVIENAFSELLTILRLFGFPDAAAQFQGILNKAIIEVEQIEKQFNEEKNDVS